LVFAVESDDVYVAHGTAGQPEAFGDGVFGEAVYILDADESFFGNRRYDAAVFDERRGGVVAVMYS
jgi:2-hydroxychromene-2-carboxylate isomerase